MPALHNVKPGILPKLSLSRPTTVIMILTASVVIGAIAYSRIPISMLPSGYENKWLSVHASYRNSTPEEVESVIARPIEDAVRTMSGISRIYSHSRADGCYVRVSFQDAVNMDDAYNQLRDRLDRVTAELPDDFRTLRIRKWTTDDMPIMWMGFPLNEEPVDLYARIQENVVRRLEQLDGVASVQLWGLPAPRIEIALVRDRINTHQVDMQSLVRALQQDNFALSGGTISEGASKLYIRSMSRFRTLQEIENLPIPRHPGLSLRDVANVTYGNPEERWYSRIDGKKSVMIGLYNESTANIVDVTRRVETALREDILTNPQLGGMDVRILFNQGEQITRSLDQLRSAGLWGGVFALIVVLFFLRRIRMTLLITGAIPLSMLISLTVIYFMGWSLNIMTMMGLIIGFGMVVDNSIVVVESIYARSLAGENPHDSSLSGTSEVGLAITVSTMTTLVVFLPLIFMGGDARSAFYMGRIGLPVVFALLGSLVVALLFIPLLTSKLLSGRRPQEPWIIEKGGSLYARFLNWVMKHRLETALFALAIFATISYPMQNMMWSGGGFGRPRTSVYVRIRVPRHFSDELRNRVLSAYEDFADQNRELYRATKIEMRFRRGSGRLRIFTESEDNPWYIVAWDRIKPLFGLEVDTPMTSADIRRHFGEHAPRYAGVQLSVDWQQSDEQRTSVTLFGDNTETLVRYAEELERRMRLLPGVTEVNSDIEEGDDELQLMVNRRRAQDYSLNGREIARSLSNVVRGRTLSPFQAESREIDMWVGLREDDRQSLDQVLNIVVEGTEGQRASVGQLVNVAYGTSLQSIRRENSMTRVVVTAISQNSDLRNLGGSINALMEEFELPKGYQWSLSGRFQSMRDEAESTNFAIIMAIAFVFLLMGILFESFVLPLSVILSIPFSFLGVYWMLYLTESPFDLMARIGSVILVGVVVNNAIVLVDLVNRLRAEGIDRTTALIEAGRRRFRPILMTSMTTVFGLLPMSVADPQVMGTSYATLGRAMIGGLLVSTLLTLFVVPLFYSLLDDLRSVTARAVSLITAHTSSSRGRD